MKIKINHNGEEIIMDTQARLFQASDKATTKREETIVLLGIDPTSHEAEIIRAMTDAFFAEGMGRSAQIAEMMSTGKLTKQELIKFINEK